MSKHRSHIPRDENHKGIANTTKGDAKELSRIARQQGAWAKRMSSTPRYQRNGRAG
jgi:hypothetical protein